MSWYTQAKAVIDALDQTLPADLSISERRKAVKDAYPFGMRQFYPYKMWCKAQREYLARYLTPENDPKQAAWKQAMEARGFTFTKGDSL